MRGLETSCSISEGSSDGNCAKMLFELGFEVNCLSLLLCVLISSLGLTTLVVGRLALRTSSNVTNPPFGLAFPTDEGGSGGEGVVPVAAYCWALVAC